MMDEKKGIDSKPVRTLQLNSSMVIKVTEPLTEEDAEIIRVLGGFDDEAKQAPREP